VHYDNRVLPLQRLLDLLLQCERSLPAIEDMEVPTRIVYLPLSWDDAATRLAIERYTQSVRKDAPWCPSNIEFIRRINGLDSIDDVHHIVFDASYLVLGLGDVYLGAPVATPVDPRHRLVTTKYNPARTWTPENAVGIGGAYLCVYGMEGPGGYQFVGRTVQMWNRYKSTAEFGEGKPWLLRFFDQIRFYPVSERELLAMREDFPQGKFSLRIEEEVFSLRRYNAFLRDNAASISQFKARQQAAFEAERERWRAAGRRTMQAIRRSLPHPRHRTRLAAQRTRRIDARGGKRVEDRGARRRTGQGRRPGGHRRVDEDGDRRSRPVRRRSVQAVLQRRKPGGGRTGPAGDRGGRVGSRE